MTWVRYPWFFQKVISLGLSVSNYVSYMILINNTFFIFCFYIIIFFNCPVFIYLVVILWNSNMCSSIICTWNIISDLELFLMNIYKSKWSNVFCKWIQLVSNGFCTPFSTFNKQFLILLHRNPLSIGRKKYFLLSIWYECISNKSF